MNTNSKCAEILETLFNPLPVLSMPYGDIEDCMDSAPECAFIWLDPHNGTYQFSPCGCDRMRHIKDLARGVHEVSDLCLIAWRNRGFWECYGE